MRKVNQITYDLINIEFKDFIKAEYKKGETINIILTETYTNCEAKFMCESKPIFKKFKIR